MDNFFDRKKMAIKEFKKTHGDKYDYSQIDYIDNWRRIKIICPDHGPFETTPNNHKRGIGCSDCYYSNIKVEFKPVSNKNMRDSLYEQRYSFLTKRLKKICKESKIEGAEQTLDAFIEFIQKGKVILNESNVGKLMFLDSFEEWKEFLTASFINRVSKGKPAERIRQYARDWLGRDDPKTCRNVRKGYNVWSIPNC